MMNFNPYIAACLKHGPAKNILTFVDERCNDTEHESLQWLVLLSIVMSHKTSTILKTHIGLDKIMRICLKICIKIQFKQ